MSAQSNDQERKMFDGRNGRRVAGWSVAIALMVALTAYSTAGLHSAASSGASPAPALSGSTPSSTTSPTTLTPLVASGPMTPLGLTSEVGAAIGGVPNPSVPVPLSQRDLVIVTLPFRNPAALSSFLTEVSNPQSPMYAHFLSGPQFVAEYGPPLADQQGLANYLESRGLTTTFLSTDHLTVAVEGTLTQLEAAFGVTFQMYSKDGQTFFAPTASPSVPLSLAPWVENIQGLTDRSAGFHPDVLYNPALGAAGSPSNGPGVGVMDYPNQMPYEFQLNQLWNATGNKSAGIEPSFAKGVTIATALWDLNTSAYCPYSLTDIDTFFNGTTGSGIPTLPAGFPAPKDHANYNVTGAPTYGPGTGNCTAGVSQVGPTTATEELDFEMTIDQEYSGADAPGALIEPTYVGGLGVTNGVNNSNLELLLAWLAEGNVPNLDVLSQSFGGGESTNFEPYYEEMAAEGVTVAASSGDNNGACGPGGPTACAGNAVCDTGTPPTQYSWNTVGTPTVDYPGSSPNVLAVGGSANMALGSPTDPGAILPGQTVWNWCPTFDGGLSGGSTGGVSSIFTEPTYQSSVPLVNQAMKWASEVYDTGNFTTGLPPTGCEGCDDNPAATPTARAVPDVAGPAADMTGYMAGTWVTGYGGTSFSSPSVAGMIGSIDAFDGHKVGFINTALYQLEQQYLAGGFHGLPFPVAPTYYVQNYSNAFFNGSTDYNTSAGWGVPQAYNIALLLGKPFVSTNPNGAATVGRPYPITATVNDDRAVSHVNVTYLAADGSWATVPLALTSGTDNSGTWTGAIPSFARSGVLRYCVDAVDQGMGNSWSPYNQSAWAATGGANLAFGCTVPFTVPIHAGVQATKSVVFAETGLARGTTWCVTLGTTLCSSGTTVAFKDLPSGSYPYSLGSIGGMTTLVLTGGKWVVQSSGTATVATASITVHVRYAWPVAFSETGLPAGTAWGVTIGGFILTSTASTIEIYLTNGSYAFYVHGVVNYVRSPASGRVVVAGAPVSKSIAFTKRAAASPAGGDPAAVFRLAGAARRP
jgi:subtilase family serine protease